MDQFDALVGVGQLGVAISGFAGVVFALSGRDTIARRENRGRLRVLLANGLGACIFSLLPQLLWGLVSPEIVWALSSALWLLYASIDLTRGWLTARRDSAADSGFSARISKPLMIVSTVFAGIVMSLQVANIVLWQGFHAFFLGLVTLLVISALMFVRLVAAELATQQGVEPEGE